MSRMRKSEVIRDTFRCLRMALQSQNEGLLSSYGTEGREFESLLARGAFLQISPLPSSIHRLGAVGTIHGYQDLARKRWTR